MRFDIFISFPGSFSATPILKTLHVFLASFHTAIYSYLIVTANMGIETSPGNA
jgi:hypothetical protein